MTMFLSRALHCQLKILTVYSSNMIICDKYCKFDYLVNRLYIMENTLSSVIYFPADHTYLGIDD